MDITESINEYILDQKIRGNSEKTIYYYSNALNFFAQSITKTDTRDITVSDCKQYYVSLVESNRKNSVSVQTYIRAMRAYLSWLYANEHIAINIPLRFKLPKAEKKVIEVLTEQEVKRIFATFDESTYLGMRNLCICTLMYDSGLRLNEILTLQVSKIYLTDGYIIVSGKGNKQRASPIGKHNRQQLRRFLKMLPKQAEYLFTKIDGEPMQASTVHDLFRRLAERSGVKRLHPHLFRHTFATRYLENGGNVYNLQAILGHTSLEMVKKYLHISTKTIVTNFTYFSPNDQLHRKKGIHKKLKT